MSLSLQRLQQTNQNIYIDFTYVTLESNRFCKIAIVSSTNGEIRNGCIIRLILLLSQGTMMSDLSEYGYIFENITSHDEFSGKFKSC